MIFVDTGAFLARYLAKDQHHEAARRAWRELETSRLPCATSSLVLDELVTLLCRRAGASFGAETGRRILASPSIKILRPAIKDEEAALGLLEKFGDQSLSFTDAVSFALMRQARITRAFGFDRHFTAAGFELWPHP